MGLESYWLLTARCPAGDLGSNVKMLATDMPLAHRRVMWALYYGTLPDAVS